MCNRPPAGLLQPLSIPERPWSHIALDFVTGLPSSQGHTTVLIIVDCFSKAAHFCPLRKLPSAFETAEQFVKHVFKLHGIPTEVVSDRCSCVWKAFCSSLGAKVSLSSGYHPQTNGQTERLNQELEAAIRCVTTQDPSTWSQQLPWIEYAHNSLTSAATGLSPFESSLGYQPTLFPELEGDLEVPSVQHHLQQAQRTWVTVLEALQRTANENRRQADRHRSPAPQYIPGQMVWLSTKDGPLKASTKKLSPCFIGPFEN